jgi:hypothetical protein
MNIESFADELLDLRAGESLVKQAMTMAEAREFIRRTEANEFEGKPQTKAHLAKGYKAHEIVTGHRKAASKARLFERFGAIGAAAGLGSHGIAHGRAALTENPWDTPRDTVAEAAIKGGVGGLTAAGVIKLLGMIASRGKR